MIFLTNENELNFSIGIVSLYFYSSWMPFHKKMVVMINKIEERYTNYKFIAIDTDHFKGFCKRFDVKSIPMVIIFAHGVEKDRIEGVVLTSAFRNKYNELHDKYGE